MINLLRCRFSTGSSSIKPDLNLSLVIILMVEVNRPLTKFHLTNNRPLTAGGETIFELIDHYLLVLMQD